MEYFAIFTLFEMKINANCIRENVHPLSLIYTIPTFGMACQSVATPIPKVCEYLR